MDNSEENYNLFPDYLFAKTNLAQIYIGKGEYNQVPPLFDYNFDLKLLYPKRKKFHSTEFISFMATLSSYFYGIGEDKKAKKYYKLMKQVDKHHYMTKQTRRIIYPPLFLRILRKLLGAKMASKIRAEMIRKNVNDGDT